jgi:hypothetical protein
VQAIAQTAVERFGPVGAFGATEPGPPFTAGYLARAVWWFARYSITRLHHDEFKATFSAFPEKKQLLIAPNTLLSQANPAGDCSAFTMAICALLRCLGVQYELVAVATNPTDPTIFTHVYARAVLDGGALLPLDAHAGDYPGWEVPASDVHRKQVYDASGSPIADRPSSFKGLHQYMAWNGLGQDCIQYADDGSCEEYDTTAPVYGPAAPTVPASAPYTLSGSAVTAPATVAPSSTPAIVSELSSLFNFWSQIGGRVVAPTTTITSGGQTITTPYNAASAIPGTNLSSSSLMTILLLGGAVLVAVKVFGSK